MFSANTEILTLGSLYSSFGRKKIGLLHVSTRVFVFSTKAFVISTKNFGFSTQNLCFNAKNLPKTSELLWLPIFATETSEVQNT
jgi:hypothetical protein